METLYNINIKKMRKLFTLFTFVLAMLAQSSWAEDATWKFVWDTSRSSGGEGFYNISDHSLTTQVETLNGLQWTLESDSHATGYTATSGQYFGSTTYPITQGTLSTSYLKGKIKKVSLEMKKKTDGQVVNIGVSVGGTNYGEVSLTTEKAVYEYTPEADAAEGDIVISMAQPAEEKSIIYFFSMEIIYEGEGVVQPVIEKVSPQLSFAETAIEMYADDMTYNPITNPFNVSPIKYSSADNSIVVASSNNGTIYSMKPGTTTITATFEGNDQYLPETASYTVTVVEKPVIAAPEFDVKGGTFTAPVTVTITSDDPLCKAIWYSTTITNVDDLGWDEQTIIVPGTKAEVTLNESCTLLAVAVGDNNVGLPTMYEFVINIAQEPVANIGLPDEAYYSPTAFAFVPLNIPVTFRDASTGEPNFWSWEFEGTDIATSAEQNPTVVYSEQGTYEVRLGVSNSMGKSSCGVSGVRAGGSELIWNIAPTETADLAEVALGWYGSYAGTNWLGMGAFAERFNKPAATAKVDKVTAYFASTVSDADTDISVSLCKADANGMPGEILATTSLKVSELSNAGDKVAEFSFDEAVTVDTDFFIVVSGFPEGYSDDVSLLCLRRGEGGKNTAYQYLLDEDENYNYLDTGKWYANSDDPLSIALSAHLIYDEEVSGISNVATAANEEIYTLDGMRVDAIGKSGVYIIRNGEKVRKVYVK